MRYLFLMLAFLGLPSRALAADHMNLEEGLPTRLEDARPIAFQGREVQAFARYDHERDEDTFELVPRFEYGLFRNTQVSIEAPVVIGEGDKAGSGDVSVEALYSFWQEGVWLPSVALAAFADLPSGLDTIGVDPGAKLLVTKMPIMATSWLHELHVNFEGKRNTARAKEENEYRVSGIAGTSFRLGADTIGILDFARYQMREKGKIANLAEGGLRRQVTPFTVISLGVQVGVNQDAPDFGATLGWQMSF